MHRWLMALCALALLAVACGEGGAVPTRPATTTVPPRPTTTTLPPASTTTLGVTVPCASVSDPGCGPVSTITTRPDARPYAIGTPGLGPPPVLPESEGPNGSGCVPGSNTVIPDGIWFGNVLATTGTTITFDMACWFWGDLAEAEAAKDGEEALNNYYIRNQNPLTFEVPIGPSATMYWLDVSSGNFIPEPMPMADWPGPDEAWPCPGDLCGVWLYINDGVITEAIEQYRP